MPEDKNLSLIELALERFKRVSEIDQAWREASIEDVKFSALLEQWPAALKTKREAKGKPCLVMDHMNQSIMQICNQYRQQRPAINVNPVGDESDVDTAEILQGIVRHIEVVSDAEIPRDTAFEQMVRGGYGVYRVITEKVGEQQEIKIKRIRNQFSVYIDYAAQEPDYSDARWAFITEDVPLKEYKALYGESTLAKTYVGNDNKLVSAGNLPASWVSDQEGVRIAEYFVKESDKWIWHKINAVEVLETTDWVGKYLPIIAVLGHDLDVDGKRHLSGMVRNGKDPQRMVNYFFSKATETVALANAAPFVAAAGQVEDYAQDWSNANTGDVVVLKYKPLDVGGGAVPPPQRETAEPPIQAMSVMAQMATENLKAAIGLYDPSLGKNKSDQSGSAIQKLQAQGDQSTLNYIDNAARSTRYEGRVLIDLIPRIYNTARVQRIIKPDGSAEMVVIHNGADQAGDAQALLSEKIKKIYDIGTGTYDIAVSVEQSYQTKRKEAVATQLDLMKILPPEMVANVIDIPVRNMDIPGGKELADRLQRMIPPQILGGDQGDPKMQVQQMQGQMQQLAQQHQQMQQALEAAHQIIQTKQVEQQGKVEIAKFESQTKMSIEQMKIEAQITIAEITTKAQNLQFRAKMENDSWNQLHGDAHEAEMQAQQQGHEQQMGQQQAEAASQQQDQQAGNQAALADQTHQQNMEAQASAPAAES